MSQNELQPEPQQVPDITGEVWTEADALVSLDDAAIEASYRTERERLKIAVKSDLEKLALISAGLYEPAEEEVPVPKKISEMQEWLEKIRKIEAQGEEQAAKERAEAEAKAKAEREEAEQEAKEKRDELGSSVALYILMRTDLASLNPGKAVAQGSHAANLFERAVRVLREGFPHAPNVAAYDAWSSDRGFGTAITLSVTGDQLTTLIAQAQETGCIAGVCTDPTYPLRDGDVTHLLRLDTCGYIFGNREMLSAILGELSLMY